eukprot:351335-Chlamydomonas_euryale.AAC.12
MAKSATTAPMSCFKQTQLGNCGGQHRVKNALRSAPQGRACTPPTSMKATAASLPLHLCDVSHGRGDVSHGRGDRVGSDTALEAEGIGWEVILLLKQAESLPFTGKQPDTLQARKGSSAGHPRSRRNSRPTVYISDCQQTGNLQPRKSSRPTVYRPAATLMHTTGYSSRALGTHAPC